MTDSPAGRCAKITKQRDLPTKGDRIGFNLHVVTLGLTKWMQPATSCVVVAAEAIKAKRATLGANQTIALNALEESLRTAIDFDKEGAPQGRPGIRFDDAIAIVTPLMPVEAKHKRERAKDAIAGLVRLELLSEKGEWLTRNQSPQH